VPTEVLALDNVSKRYGDHDALRGVQFSLDAGEAVGYLGPNGAGKSTTLKLLVGLSRPTAGSIRLLGLSPYEDRVRALRRVGALVETPGIPPYLTGSDLLSYIARIKDVPAAEIHAAVRRAVDAVGGTEHLGRPFGALSTGLARRMLLAAALVGEPEVLLLDEPTLGLDPAARQDLRELLRSLSRTGLTLLISTHLLEDVQEVCGRVLFLRAGELVGDESVRDEPTAGTRPSRRSLRVEFGTEISAEMLARAIGPEFEVEVVAPRRAVVRFGGDDRAQADVVSRLVRAGLPLLAASPPVSDLERRYLELIGREDAR
jgi:ABC-2 type transport system ATP-binding protein